MEDEGKLAIIDACSTKIGIPSHEKYVDVRPFDIRSLIDLIVLTQDDINAKRIVLDSSSSFGFYLMEPTKFRIELLKLSMTLEVLGLTSLLICDLIDGSMTSRFNVENFITDGTILMNYEQINTTRLHSIEIFKMRGSNHSKNLHIYEISPNGIYIHPKKELENESYE